MELFNSFDEEASEPKSTIPKKATLNRSEFLAKITALLGAGATLLANGTSANPTSPEVDQSFESSVLVPIGNDNAASVQVLYRRMNITDFPYTVAPSEGANMETLESRAGKITILYSDHNIPIDTTQFPDNLDGIAFDTGGAHHFEPILQEEKYGHYKPLDIYVRKNKTPIFSLDFAPLERGSSLLFDGGIMAGEAGIGALLLRDASRDRTRRSILKALTGAYLTMPFLSTILRKFPDLRGETSKSFAHMTNKIHPEYNHLLTKIRDAIMAINLRHLMQYQFQREGNQKQNSLVILGANHVEFGRNMQRPMADLLHYIEEMRHIIQLAEEPELAAFVSRSIPQNKGCYTCDSIVVSPLRDIVCDRPLTIKDEQATFAKEPLKN